MTSNGIETRGTSAERLAAHHDYFHKLEDGRLECDVCPRHCQLHDGQRGLCFVRAREGERIVSTTYGRSSGYCVDPIEKKPLYHFLPGTPILSFGTAGCNLTCQFCQNWNISKSREMDTLADEASPESIAEAAQRLGCRSVAYTYNDPVIFLEYAMDTAQACRQLGVRSVAVTAGYVCPEARRDFFAQMDATNIDLKAFNPETYHKVCGGKLEAVLDTLVYVKKETSVWLELTTLLVPGMNDSEAELQAECAWIVEALGPDVPLHFSAFHPDYRMQDRMATPPSVLKRAREIAHAAGIRYAYTGNVFDPAGQSTYCHECKTCVIERSGYEIWNWQLDERGQCLNCKTPCAGVFDPKPGNWGSRRMPVRMQRDAAHAAPDLR